MEPLQDYQYRQVLLQTTVFDQWLTIGREEGLKSDTAIASFLIELYEEKQKGVQLGENCVHCQALLTSVCMRCQQPSALDQHNFDVLASPIKSSENTFYQSQPLFKNREQKAKMQLLQVIDTCSSDDPEENSSQSWKNCEASDIYLDQDANDKFSNADKPKLFNDNGCNGKKAQENNKSLNFRVKHITVKRDGCVEEQRMRKIAVDRTKSQSECCRRQKQVRTTPIHGIGIQTAPLQKMVITPDQIITDEDGSKLYACKVCRSVFKDRGKLDRHHRTHTGEKPFQCTVCLMTFARDTDLARHRLSHSHDRPWVCDVCGARYKYSNNLTDHVKTHSDKEHTCPHCPSAFFNYRDLVIHLRSHTGELPYACELCGHMFSRLSSLVKHRDSHEGRHPFPCRLCPKTFSQTNAIKRHMLTVHKVSNSEIFACSLCTEKFARTRDLKQHFKVAHHGPPKGNERIKYNDKVEPLETNQEQGVTQIQVLDKSGSGLSNTKDSDGNVTLTNIIDISTTATGYVGLFADRVFKSENESRQDTVCFTQDPIVNKGEHSEDREESVTFKEEVELSLPCYSTVRPTKALYRGKRKTNNISKSTSPDDYLQGGLKKEKRTRSQNTEAVSVKCDKEGYMAERDNRKTEAKIGGVSSPDSWTCDEDNDSSASFDSLPKARVKRGKKMSRPKKPAEKTLQSTEKWVCDVCGLMLSAKNCLIRHRRQVHGKNAPFICKQCDKRFHRSYTLKQHILLVHDHVRQHMCFQCGFVFGNRHHLKRHCGTQKPGGSFQCPDCQEHFVCHKQFLKHLKTHPPKLRGKRGSYKPRQQSFSQ